MMIPPREESEFVEDGGLQCLNCQKSYKDELMSQVVFLDRCGHMVCKECLAEDIKISYPQSRCPVDDCEKDLYDFEIREALGQKEYDNLQ